MELSYCKFSRFAYETLQESEVDPKALDDPLVDLRFLKTGINVIRRVWG